MRILSFFLLLGGALAFAGCDSNSERDEVIDLMTRAPWITVDAPPESGLAGRYTFRDDGNLQITFDSGAEPRSTQWTVSEDADAIRVIVENDTERRLPILELTEDDLVLDFGEDGTISFVHEE